MVKAGEPPRLVCTACGFVFYLDPKVASGAVFSFNGGIVLVRRAIEPSYGKWVFPGGYVDLGESTQEAAIRETLEEAGVKVTLQQLAGVYSYPGQISAVVVYLAACPKARLLPTAAGPFLHHRGWDRRPSPSRRAVKG